MDVQQHDNMRMEHEKCRRVRQLYQKLSLLIFVFALFLLIPYNLRVCDGVFDICLIVKLFPQLFYFRTGKKIFRENVTTRKTEPFSRVQLFIPGSLPF